MLWFGKKNKVKDEEKDLTENDVETYEIDEDDVEEDEATDEEILESLNEDAVEVDSIPDDEIPAEAADASADIAKTVTSLDELAEFVNSKGAASMQFMRKSNNEVFALREVHLRLAKVWSSVSMARECTPSEYIKIMLASELIDSPEDFYVLPTLSEAEREEAIIGFCAERYGGNGKKYVRNTEKFARLVNDNGDKEEWLAYTKWIITNKVTEFCENNGIVFETCESSEEKEDE